jgi:hypothetical protein
VNQILGNSVLLGTLHILVIGLGITAAGRVPGKPVFMVQMCHVGEPLQHTQVVRGKECENSTQAHSQYCTNMKIKFTKTYRMKYENSIHTRSDNKVVRLIFS